MSAKNTESAGRSRLMVLIPDRLSSIVEKGEVTSRYYNPGNIFDEVHIVITNNDDPDLDAVQKMVGDAKLFIYNLPDARKQFVPSLGWRPWLLRKWVSMAVELAREIQPVLIRCHGALLNTFAASEIKRQLGIPYVVSMHTNPDVDIRGRADSVIKRIVTLAQQDIERIGLMSADLVMPVYQPILPFLERIGVTRAQVCYNTLNPDNLHIKQAYTLHDPVRVISVGRQFREKNPDNLIRAVAQLPNVQLAMVGDGPLNEYLTRVAEDCGVKDRVVFSTAIPNDELCRRLPDYDIFATHTEYFEISKAVLESLLTGLPVLLNQRIGDPVPELTSDICSLVENTVDGYRSGLERLIQDSEYRESLGRAAFARAEEIWKPEKTEAVFVEIYKRIARARGVEL